MGNGAPETGDGWKFRGRGIFQLTGREMYTRFQSRETEIPILSDPDILLQPAEAVISACWFWEIKKMNPSADAKDVTQNTRILNGGTIGINDRRKKYDLVQKGL